LFLNTLYLQDVRGFTALRAGLLTIPMAVMIAVFASVSGRNRRQPGTADSLPGGWPGAGHRSAAPGPALRTAARNGEQLAQPVREGSVEQSVTAVR
jgi:hypothetical protein